MLTYERLELERNYVVGGYIALVEIRDGFAKRWQIHYRSGAHTGRWMFYDLKSAKESFESRARLGAA